METILVAVMVSLVAPTVMALVTGRQRSQEKREDWDRQDAVADQAAKAAALLLAANERVAEAAVLQVEKLDALQVVADATHVLVNSNLTAAKQTTLDGLRRELILLHAAEAPTEAIDIAVSRIAELETELAGRAVSQAAVDKAAE